MELLTGVFVSLAKMRMWAQNRVLLPSVEVFTHKNAEEKTALNQWCNYPWSESKWSSVWALLLPDNPGIRRKGRLGDARLLHVINLVSVGHQLQL